MNRPTGFTLLAFYCAIKVLQVATTGWFRGDYSDAPVPSGLALLAAMFAAVAAEALWRCRPWCFRAFLSYVCIASVAWMAGAGDPASELVGNQLVTRLLISLAAVLYVRSQARKLFGPPAPPRISIPAPRP